MLNVFSDSAADKEAALAKERYFLAREHMTLMAIPMFSECSGKHAYPHINCELPSGAMRSLAGNVTWLGAFFAGVGKSYQNKGNMLQLVSNFCSPNRSDCV